LKYKANFSDYAKEDKISIKNYLSKFYPETPRRFTTALKKHINNIKENPYMYPICPENPEFRRID
jgi:plasmid stabilization system protein ParE